jgi:hypothetical protein
MRSYLLVAVTAVVVVSASGCETTEIRSRPLHGPDFRQTYGVLLQVMEDANALVQEAIEVVGGLGPDEVDATNFERREIAIGILGRFPSPRAIDVLLKVVDVPPSMYTGWADEDPALACPALDSLIAIGPRAADACLRELTKDYPDARRIKLCYVIAAVHGRDVARFILEREVRRCRNDPGRGETEQFESALKLFDKRFPLGKDEP